MKTIDLGVNTHLYEALKIAQIFENKSTGATFRRMSNPYGKSVEVAGSAKKFRGGQTSLIVCECDKNGILIGDPYVAEAEAFNEGHAPVIKAKSQ